MKLLIVTQKLDENDPILGFFCRWVLEFAKHFDAIHVIAFQAGEYHLPKNVFVHSLGKEKGTGKVARALTYLSLVFSLRREYTHVFAHMSPEYVLAAGWFWKLSGKKIALWYNHTQKSLRLSLAAAFADIVFHTSPYAAPAQLKKAKRMPAGIDTELFKPQDVPKEPMRVYFQGRVAPAKRVEEMARAVRIVRGRGVPATLTVVGPEEAAYGAFLRKEFADLTAEGAISFLGPKPPSGTPALYSAARVSVNLTAEGNYDKTVLESMACETPVIVSSPAFNDIAPAELTVPEENAEALAGAVTKILALPEAEYAVLGEKLRSAVSEKHNVVALGTGVFEALHTV